MVELEFPQSNLFAVADIPPIDPAVSKAYIPRGFRTYNPLLAHQIEERYPQVRLQESEFDNRMLLLLAREAPNVVLPWLMNGDNWDQAILDIIKLHPFTQSHFGFKPNVEQLSVLSTFSDLRQDLPSRKPLSTADLRQLFGAEITDENAEYFSLVAAQGSWSLVTAQLMGYVAKVKQLITIDSHSFVAKEQFEQEGVQVINVTTARLMIETFRHNRLLDDSLPTMIVGVDFGNLSLAHKLSKEEGFELGIIRKKRIPGRIPGTSETFHELVHGDVSGKRIILMDDMISSGGTILKTIKLLLDAGAAEIIVAAAHAVFDPREYYDRLREVVANEKVKLVLVSDTLPLIRPTGGDDKDLPYVLDEKSGERKSVQMMPTSTYVDWLIGMMLAHPEYDQRVAAFQPHVLPQEDPLVLYERLTGKKVPRPRIVASYHEGGELRPAPSLTNHE